MSCWSHEKACAWLAHQLRHQPDQVEQQIEDLLGHDQQVEELPCPCWDNVLPQLDQASRQWLQEILQRPRLTPAEEVPLLRQWRSQRQQIRQILADQGWSNRLRNRLQQLVEAGQLARQNDPGDEPTIALGQRAAELQTRLTRLSASPQLDQLLQLGSVSPRMLQILGPDLLEGLAHTGRLLEPLLGRRLQQAAALCWSVLPDPIHFLVLVQRPISGLLAALDRLDRDDSAALDARVGWMQRLEIERWRWERESLQRLSQDLRRQLGRRPTLQQLATAFGQPEALLDHWEMNPNLLDLGPIQSPLSRSQAAYARKWRSLSHTAAEIRVLLLRYGIGCAPQETQEISQQFDLPTDLIGRLEDLATRKRMSPG